ncbi:MAG: hypothetical protein ACRD2D_07265, partial [Terriglobales bacterium]
MAKSAPAAKAKPERTPPKNGKAAKPAPARKAESQAKSVKPDKKPRPELGEKVAHLIAEEMAIEEAEITAACSFKEDLNLDEIDVAELLMQAEIEFGLHPFSESDWEACETVGDMT